MTIKQKISNFFDSEFLKLFITSLVPSLVTGLIVLKLTNEFQQSTSDQQDKANQLKYEQELVNKYMEDVKGLLLNEYRSKDADPEITHVEIANFVASKTSSLLKTITDPEQRQRLINFLRYSSIATIPEYRYPLYFPDNICSRVSRVKSKYYVDFLCTLNLSSDQKKEGIKDDINSNINELGCLKKEYKNRIDMTGIFMSDMILENVDFRGTILENSVFDRAQLDQANFRDTLLYESSFFNTDLQYADMNCAQLKKAKFFNSFMKGVGLSNADLSQAMLVGSNLRNADLYKANLSSTYLGVNMGLYREKIATRNILDLREADLSDADLTGAQLIKVDLRGAKNLETIKQLKGIKCENSIINRESYNALPYDFRINCPLKVIAPNENLKEANLSGFDLSGEDLSMAKLKGADLRKTDLRGAILENIDFNDETCFNDAIYDKKTIFPEDIKKIIDKDKKALNDKKTLKIIDEKTCDPQNLESKGLLEISPGSTVREGADLSFANLQYVNLSNSNLTGVNLAISNLSYARLFYAKLTRATLKDANLTEANLEGAILIDTKLNGANFIEANLRDADLTGANLQEAILIRSDLRGAKLSQAILERLPKLDDAIYDDKTELPFSDKKAKDYGMWKIAPGSDLKGAILREVDLRGANLCNAVIDDKTRLDSALFNEKTQLPKKISPNDKCKESNRKLSLEEIKKAQDEYNMVFIPSDNWKKCDKSILKLRRANLPGVEFKDADLSGADLSGANLRGTYWKVDVNLKEAKFTGADLRNATFGKVDLSEVDLTGADLRGANLSDTKHLSVSKLNNICYDKLTQFPPGIKPPSDPVCKS